MGRLAIDSHYKMSLLVKRITHASVASNIEVSAVDLRVTIGGESLTDEVEFKNIMSKIALLTLSFPTLRLLWCRRPQVRVAIHCGWFNLRRRT